MMDEEYEKSYIKILDFLKESTAVLEFEVVEFEEDTLVLEIFLKETTDE